MNEAEADKLRRISREVADRGMIRKLWRTGRFESIGELAKEMRK
jgi:hypothetical protein